MNSSQRKQSRPSATGGGGGGPQAAAPVGSPEQMQMLLKYLPTILKVAKQAPGIVVGFLITLLYQLAWVGAKEFKESVAPVGGFHLFLFFMLRELYPLWGLGWERVAALRQRREAQKTFMRDIAMQYHEKLD